MVRMRYKQVNVGSDKVHKIRHRRDLQNGLEFITQTFRNRVMQRNERSLVRAWVSGSDFSFDLPSSKTLRSKMSEAVEGK